MNILTITNDEKHKDMFAKLDKYFELAMEKGEENIPNKILKEMKFLATLIEEYEEKRWPINREIKQ